MNKPLGCAFLESFSELENWSEDEVDPLSRANTPLFIRPGDSRGSRGEGSNVMIIHDYKGGYNNYEASQGSQVSEEEQLYSCDYLQYVECFTYFSHKLVTIPPPTWINSCHRAGVKCLGTFLVEPGSMKVDRILELDEDGVFWVAQALSRIARTYGFDGWLVNIECSFSLLSWSSVKLENFLGQLRSNMGEEGKIVWYDAITTLNFVWYQNSLNTLNIGFALAAGSMLTNYAWTPKLAQQARQFAEDRGLGATNLYFGIDVWAQNVQHGPHPRVTWPHPGGGGTGTGLGVKALKDIGVSAGIFAPGWSFEHFPKHNAAIDKSVWLGHYLPSDTFCECGEASPHTAVPYQQNGITRHARLATFGTENFFHTDFRKAITRRTSDGSLYAHLGAQSPLPQSSSSPLLLNCGSTFDSIQKVHTKVDDSPARCLFQLELGEEYEHSRSGKAFGRLQLFSLNMSSKEKRLVTVKFRRPPTSCELSLIIERPGDDLSVDLLTENDATSTATVELDHGYVSGISLQFRTENIEGFPNDTTLLELYSITIQPQAVAPVCEVSHLKVEERGTAKDGHLRLIWNVTQLDEQPSTLGVPHSDITGPCAFFRIHIDNREVGRAYAFEYVLSDEDAQRWQADGIETHIEAIGFDGSILDSSKAFLSGGSDDWVVVTHLNE